MELSWREELLVGKLLEFVTQENGLLPEKERRLALALKRRIEDDVNPSGHTEPQESCELCNMEAADGKPENVVGEAQDRDGD